MVGVLGGVRWPAQRAVGFRERGGRGRQQLGLHLPKLAGGAAAVRLRDIHQIPERRGRPAGRRFAGDLPEQLKLTAAVRAIHDVRGNLGALAALQHTLLKGDQRVAGWTEHAVELLSQQPL